MEERFRLRSKSVTPSIPRKISGTSSSSTEMIGVSVPAVAALFFERIAARWLTLDAARVFFTRFTGCMPLGLGGLPPAVAVFAVLAVDVGVVFTS